MARARIVYHFGQLVERYNELGDARLAEVKGNLILLITFQEMDHLRWSKNTLFHQKFLSRKFNKLDEVTSKTISQNF